MVLHDFLNLFALKKPIMTVYNQLFDSFSRHSSEFFVFRMFSLHDPFGDTTYCVDIHTDLQFSLSELHQKMLLFNSSMFSYIRCERVFDSLFSEISYFRIYFSGIV